ncbi:N-acetylmuramoyl-L-alanine amidase [Rugosimonospora acidiphila]|uniref:N-acetylmuramoyl-L-alanine amidase n=1 Tax=Rugosimonospora acidiphila TaxID=556531 RepID=A0ABP9RMY0_9ACTN
MGVRHRLTRLSGSCLAFAVLLTLPVGCGVASARAGATWSAPPSARSATPSAAASTLAGRTVGVSGQLSLGPVAGKVIVIDPGHNGGNVKQPRLMASPVPMGTGDKACDTTGTETNGGYQEAAFTFDVSTRLAALLRAAGAKVIMTRDDDNGVGPCVDQRAAIGNDNHADVAISIHGDGAPTRDHGFHVLEPARVGAPSNAIITQSHRLATLIRDNYRARTGIPPANYIGKDGINTRGDMGGLNLSVVPKVMVECGNMRNAGDAAMMTNATDRQRMAEGFAAGLAAYLTPAG